MATADHLSSADLKGRAYGGMINDDVMQNIIDISKIPLPFTDMIGADTCDNAYTEWTTDSLGAPDLSNAVVDGADIDTTTAASGSRVGNHCQILAKGLSVTNRAQRSDTIGGNEFARQLTRKLQQNMRDLEAIALSPQASASDNGNNTAGKMGGFPSWLVTNTDRGAGGADGGFSSGAISAPTVGTTRALSEKMVRDMCQSIYEQGGNPSCLMSVPTVIRKLSEYMFTSSARIATITSDSRQTREAQVANGAVNVFVTDFGVTLDMVANRLMQVVDDTPDSENADVLFIDPEYVKFSFLQNWNVTELAKNGLADRKAVFGDVTLKVLQEAAHGVISDIDYTAAVVAGS